MIPARHRSTRMNGSFLPLEHPWVWAFAVCAIAAGLEGLCSGSDVKQRFAELSFPAPSLPLWAWSLVGVGYYVVHLMIVHALFSRPPLHPYTAIALALAAVVLTGNAIWNYLFFRRKDPRASFMLSVPYAVLASSLGGMLWMVAADVAPVYLVYLAYLPYGTWWGFAVWRRNSSRNAAAQSA